MDDFDRYLREQLNNPEFKRAYEAPCKYLQAHTGVCRNDRCGECTQRCPVPDRPEACYHSVLEEERTNGQQ